MPSAFTSTSIALLPLMPIRLAQCSNRGSHEAGRTVFARLVVKTPVGLSADSNSGGIILCAGTGSGKPTIGAESPVQGSENDTTSER